ncbi:hypothetical protein BB561_006221 [Smittium simulii]|uniref:DUF726 domain-containing protein n=1 Tax=Smittium simulii TaxID=133385 RepID=A0A2T9Y5R0_9FUNG|nr:hypothetical protein BB561_006221 [Smittium simulii]
MDDSNQLVLDRSKIKPSPYSKNSNVFISTSFTNFQEFSNQKPKTAKAQKKLCKNFETDDFFSNNYLSRSSNSPILNYQQNDFISADFYQNKQANTSCDFSLNCNSAISPVSTSSQQDFPYSFNNAAHLKNKPSSVYSDISANSNSVTPLQINSDSFENSTPAASARSATEPVKTDFFEERLSPNIVPNLALETPSIITKNTSQSSIKPQKTNQISNSIRADDSKILYAKRKETEAVSKDVLTDKQKIAYVGIVYLVLTEMYGNLGVQYSEAISSTSSFIKYFKRIMVKLYAHMQISIEEQKMIETLPRNKIPAIAMAKFLISEGDTVVVKSETSITISHEKAFFKTENTDINEIDSTLTSNTEKVSDTISSQSTTPEVDTTTLESQKQPSPLSNESNTTKIGNEQFTVIPAQQPVSIDVRGTIILDLFLLMLSDEIFDSRSRFVLRRVSEELSYEWSEVQKIERRVTKQLGLSDYAAEVEIETESSINSHVQKKIPKSLVKRVAVFGLATVGGGLVIGLSAGLLAPAIGAGLGATLGALGVANAGAFFGSVGGTVLITTGGTLAGSGIAGMKIARRTRDIENLELIPHIDNKSTNLIFTIPGWLFDQKNNTKSPFSLIEDIDGDVFSLIWDKSALLELGASFNLIAQELASTTVMQTLQHTVLPNLLGPLSIPMWLAKLGYILDNPWATGSELSIKSAPRFADALFHRVQGQRPVTLIGFSLGALHVFYVLLELAKLNAFGIIEDVILLGAPISVPAKEWRLASSVVGGRFINGYSSRDWMLKLMYRTSKIGFMDIAGLQPIPNIKHIQNVDFSAEITSHSSYNNKLPQLLSNLGYTCSSMEFLDSETLSDSPVIFSSSEDRIFSTKDSKETTFDKDGDYIDSNEKAKDVNTEKPEDYNSSLKNTQKIKSSIEANRDLANNTDNDLKKELKQEELIIDISINHILDKSIGITSSDFKKLDQVKQGPKKKNNFFTRLFAAKKKKDDSDNELDKIMYTKISNVISTSSRLSSESISGKCSEDDTDKLNFHDSCLSRKTTENFSDLESEFSQFGYSIKELNSTLSTFVIKE